MKVSRAEAQRNRERVVEAAARLFRERGFNGVGLVEVMRSAGLTHGGFYGQFGSKKALAIEACRFAFDRAVERWAELGSEGGPRAIIDFSLAGDNVKDTGNGCVAAALTSSIARHDPRLRELLKARVDDLVELLDSQEEGSSQEARRRQSIATLSSRVGATVLVLAVADEKFTDKVLDAVRHDLTRPSS